MSDKYTIKQSLVIGGKIIFLGENPDAALPFATWQNGRTDIRCFSGESTAMQDFTCRAFKWVQFQNLMDNRDNKPPRYSLLNTRMNILHIRSLPEALRETLFRGGIHTLGDLMRKLDLCDLNMMSKSHLKAIKDAIKKEHQIAFRLTKLLKENGYPTLQSVIDMTTAQILDCYGLSYDQIGRVISFQRDMAGLHFDEQDIFYITGDRVYCCTNCRYRNPENNFCGWCSKKILDDYKKKHNKK